MKPRPSVAIMVLLLSGMVVADLRAQVSPEQVRKAIDQGVGYLKGRQAQDGSWTEYPGQPGGTTALCTLALLNAGVPPDDATVQRALRYLERLSKPEKTYAVALQTMVFCRANPKQYLAQIDRNVRWLESTQIASGQRKGAWSYPGAGGDNSNTQFALLALHEAERVGVEVRYETWAKAKAYWENTQNADGSWGYQPGLSGTGSMSCAGIASLVIAADAVRRPDAQVSPDGRIQCCQAGESDNGQIERGLDWLGRNFSVSGNPGAPGEYWLLYYLYSLERAGRLTNRRFIVHPQLGAYDWYREGVKFLIPRQDGLSGYWAGTGHVEKDPVMGTALALLFLAKGRRPILLAKLRHSLPDDWNQHRSDVHNLTRFVESRWKLDLTWQVTDLQAATVEDLLQSPVLFLCGSLDPLPRDPQERQALAQKLRDYLDRGGFLFAEAFCGGAAFDAGFRRLIEEIFPEPEYRLRLLEPEHPIWRAEEPLDPQFLRPLWGVEFGCRTSVVYAPPDPPERPQPSLSCLWELSRPGRGQTYPAQVQARIHAALILGTNVLAYATNRELRGKEESFRVVRSLEPGDQLARGRIYLARLRHPGGCNAAPRALASLVEQLRSEAGLRAEARAELLDLGSPALFDYHLIFMHGRHRFRLTDTERQQLRTYLERGGMLFADAICGSSAFSESLRQELSAIFPEHRLEPIPPDDPIWTRAYGGFDLPEVGRRDPREGSAADGLRAAVRRVPPQMEGIRLGDRWAVIFSPYDVSCALERHDSLDCRGYLRDDAARLAVNIVLYSLYE